MGQHRQTFIKRSKGKRAAKKEKEASKAANAPDEPPVPPMPVLDASIDIGLNSISRNLQRLSSLKPEEMPDDPDRQYSMVFVARGNQASSFNCHFPQMVGAASRNLPTEEKTRLVGFSKPCSERLSACLGVPRISSVAIVRDAPGAGALQDFVMKNVAPVEATWLDAIQDSTYLSTNIKAIETTVGQKRVKTEQP